MEVHVFNSNITEAGLPCVSGQCRLHTEFQVSLYEIRTQIRKIKSLYWKKNYKDNEKANYSVVEDACLLHIQQKFVYSEVKIASVT